MNRITMSSSAFSTIAVLLMISGGGALRAQTPCELGGANNCHAYDGSNECTMSDLEVGWTAADDFVPLSGTIGSLCVWGQYIDTDPNGTQTDCSADAAPDDFEVQIYPNNGQQPWSDQSLGRVSASSVREPVAFAKGMIALAKGTTGHNTAFRFTLSLATPFTGLATDGTAYWLSVRNRSASAASPNCRWHWLQLSPASSAGNDFSVRGPLWGLVQPQATDFAFCLDADISPNGMGSVQRACCTCDGACTITSLAACDALGGQWWRWDTSCGVETCPSGTPPNDECTSATPIENGAFLYSTRCATASVPNPVETEFGPANIHNDLWFTYVHDTPGCNLHFSTCLSDFDSILAVYFDANNPDVCPCPTAENIETFLIASDEGCGGGEPVSSGGFVNLGGKCSDVRGCYTIRVGGFQNESGLLGLSLGCSVSGGFPVPPPQVDPLEYRKSRFLTLDFPLPGLCDLPSNLSYAFRVRMTSLHHVIPPYTGSPSIPFTSFEGQHRWIGPPIHYVESVFSGVPFVVSTLQCTPHYRDWSTLTKLHVTGSAIVPSSIYHVETLSPSCQGFENTAGCQSGGGNVSSSVEMQTSRWCDLEVPTSPPSLTLQPDLGDVAKLIQKFRDHDNPPSKARCCLVGNDIFGNFTTLAIDFSFVHIAGAVDAFRGRGYPHQISSCP